MQGSRDFMVKIVRWSAYEALGGLEMGGESLTFLVVGINSKRRNDAAKKTRLSPPVLQRSLRTN